MHRIPDEDGMGAQINPVEYLCLQNRQRMLHHQGAACDPDLLLHLDEVIYVPTGPGTEGAQEGYGRLRAMVARSRHQFQLSP
jgi:hypothetical protein